MSELIKTQINENNSMILTLNRAEVHNAFNDQMIQDITELFENLDKNEDVARVFITGEGKSFCAGADLNWMKSMADYSYEENIIDSKKLNRMFQAIDSCKLPVIGLVNGHALGGGMGMIAVCDYVLASLKGKFGFTEVNLGLIPAVISPYCINKIGVANARSYFLSGEKFDAKKAYEMNLVHQYCEHEDFEERAVELMSMFESLPAQALKSAKELIKQVSTLPVEKVSEFTCEAIANQRVSKIGQEGMSAILEKRKPNWNIDDK